MTVPFEFMHSQIHILCLHTYHPLVICSLSKHTKLTLTFRAAHPMGIWTHCYYYYFSTTVRLVHVLRTDRDVPTALSICPPSLAF